MTQSPDETRATILVVDDERGPRESLRMILTPAHDVIGAQGGVEALEILRTRPVDLVTVDLNMPGMKGDELMRTIREELPQVDVIVITGCGSVESAVEGLRYGVADYLTKPFDVVQVSASVARSLARRASRRNLVCFLEGIGTVLGKDRDANEILADLDHDDALQTRLRALLEEPILDPAATRARLEAQRTVEFLEVLADTIETRDTLMRGHARRVALYSGLLADRLCLGSQDRERVRIASFLHDLGKVGVRMDVIQSETALAEAERREVEVHAEIGERLVRPLGFSSAVASAIRHHHERWDGAGYPDRLRGDEIPLAARIIAIADAFDAMTTPRPDRGARDELGAVRELRKEAGAQFDPYLVDQWAALIDAGVCGSGIRDLCGSSPGAELGEGGR